MVQVVEHFPIKCKTLSSNPSNLCIYHQLKLIKLIKLYIPHSHPWGFRINLCRIEFFTLSGHSKLSPIFYERSLMFKNSFCLVPSLCSFHFTLLFWLRCQYTFYVLYTHTHTHTHTHIYIYIYIHVFACDSTHVYILVCVLPHAKTHKNSLLYVGTVYINVNELYIKMILLLLLKLFLTYVHINIYKYVLFLFTS
jgi:hypothetical protein